LALKVPKNDEQRPDDSGEPRRSKLRLACLLAGLAAAVLGLVFLFVRQAPIVAPEVANLVAVAQPPPAHPNEELPDAVEQNSQSDAATKQIIVDLKRFQDATERGLDYEEYNKKLTTLKTDLNDRLPSLVRHDSGDETFRQEVAAALRDYTAAGNWWKTTITNDTVLTETDRNERTQKNFESARTHLVRAEETLVRKGS